MSTTNIVSKYQNQIVSIQAGLVGEISTGSGYIYQYKNKRLYIVTCAHLLLINEGTTINASPLTPINVNITNVFLKDKVEPQNIICSTFILGMDISADIAVLCTYKPSEIDITNLYGFNFSNSNKVIPFAPSTSILDGTPIGIIANEYGSGFDITNGIISKSSFVYAAEDPNYTNYTEQLISNCDVAVGSSGAPILILEGVVAIACWYKLTGGSYVGGPNYSTLKNSINKILQLNPKPTPINSGVDFDGYTGSGFLGVGSYIPYQGSDAEALCLKYNKLATSNQASSLSGLILTSITDVNLYPIVIPKSRIQNAKDLLTRKRSGLQVDDIILVVNGTKVGYSISTAFVNIDSYYDVNSKVVVEIFRPSNGQYMTYEITPDEFPFGLNLVSIDSTIALISKTNVKIFCPPGFTVFNYWTAIVTPIKNTFINKNYVNDNGFYTITSLITGYTKNNKDRIKSLTFTHYVSPVIGTIPADYYIKDPFTTYALTYDVTIGYLSEFGIFLDISNKISEFVDLSYKPNSTPGLVENSYKLLLASLTCDSENITSLSIVEKTVIGTTTTPYEASFDTFKLDLATFYNNTFLNTKGFPSVTSNILQTP